MAAGPHTFSVLSVFSAEHFQGNPLAVVAVHGNALTQKRKSLIAKEFGYSETVFVHDALPTQGGMRRVDIFTDKGDEIPFAGHPVVGTAHYLFKYCEPAPYFGPQDQNFQYNTTVLTKAGPVSITYNSYRQVAACSIPHDVHIHSKEVDLSKVLAVQPQVQIVPTIEKLKGRSFPVVSIVKGMTFALIDLTDAPEVFAALMPGKAPELDLDEEWKPTWIGALYYRRRDPMIQAGEPTIYAIQARMITEGMEDPGTGSAGCALSCYLALTQEDAVSTGNGTTDDKLVDAAAKVKLEDAKTDSKPQRQVYAIQQGVEMGRACMIAVEVDVKRGDDGKKQIAGVSLSGRAAFFCKGELV